MRGTGKLCGFLVEQNSLRPLVYAVYVHWPPVQQPFVCYTSQIIQFSPNTLSNKLHVFVNALSFYKSAQAIFFNLKNWHQILSDVSKIINEQTQNLDFPQIASLHIWYLKYY